MTLLHLIVMASLMCAGLMYAAGYLWGSRPRSTASGSRLPTESPEERQQRQAELAQLTEALADEQRRRASDRARIDQALTSERAKTRAVEQQLAEAERARAEAANRHAEMSAQTERTEVERRRAEAERDRANADRDRAESDRDQAEAERDRAWANSERHRAEVARDHQEQIERARTQAAAEADAQWRGRVEALEDQLAQQDVEAQRELAAEHAEATTRWKARIQSLEEALTRSAGDLESAKSQLAELEELREAAADRDALRLDVGVLKRRLEEMERLRKRAEDLEAELASAEGLKNALAEAREEVEELRAQGLRRTVPQVQILNDPGGTPDEAVRSIAARSGHRSTVVADDLGFPIVGYGEHQEHLAALCGVLIEVHERARGLLPLGRIHRVTLETDRGLTVSACSGEHQDSTITLATLTAGPGLETPELREALSHFSSALDRGEHRSTEEM